MKFDRLINRKGFGNRSEAIRDLVRDCVAEEDVEMNRAAVGTLTLVYDHHKPGLATRLITLRHDMHEQVLAATHVHLDHQNCLEVIIVKGRSLEMKSFADKILSLRGVKHGKFVLARPLKTCRKTRTKLRQAPKIHAFLYVVPLAVRAMLSSSIR
jgi:CopG family transcriptional regulator, nickel-responsive regulator